MTHEADNSMQPEGLQPGDSGAFDADVLSVGSAPKTDPYLAARLGAMILEVHARNRMHPGVLVFAAGNEFRAVPVSRKRLALFEYNMKADPFD